LLLHEHGFGHDGTRTAGTGEEDDSGQQMQKKDGEIAHTMILATSQNTKNVHESGNSPCTRCLKYGSRKATTLTGV
jgi:hypothetical protein